jgi:hypothetical protein
VSVEWHRTAQSASRPGQDDGFVIQVEKVGAELASVTDEILSHIRD